eukprot:s498_g7.t1
MKALPAPWERHFDPATGCAYYVDADTQESTWDCPLIPCLRRVLQSGRRYLTSPSEGFFEEQKVQLWERLKADLDCWYGPLESPEGRAYFAHSLSGHSSWRDPRVDTQFLFDLEGGLLDSLAEMLPPPEELQVAPEIVRSSGTQGPRQSVTSNGSSPGRTSTHLDPKPVGRNIGLGAGSAFARTVSQQSSNSAEPSVAQDGGTGGTAQPSEAMESNFGSSGSLGEGSDIPSASSKTSNPQDGVNQLMPFKRQKTRDNGTWGLQRRKTQAMEDYLNRSQSLEEVPADNAKGPKPVTPDNIAVNLRVQRGPDWQRGQEDRSRVVQWYRAFSYLSCMRCLAS